MRYAGTILQLMLFALFIACYIAVIIPAALVAALRRPEITPGRRVKTTIGYGNRRIY